VDGVHGAQGNAQLNWKLGVPPAASGPPVNLVLAVGSTLALDSGTTGIPVPAYQWRCNGTDLLVDAVSSSYSLPNIQRAQAGTYSVVASNFMGVVTNTIAVVTVLIPNVLYPTVVNSAAGAASLFQIQCIATNQPAVLQMTTNLVPSFWVPLFTNSDDTIPINYFRGMSTSPPTSFFRLVETP